MEREIEDVLEGHSGHRDLAKDDKSRYVDVDLGDNDRLRDDEQVIYFGRMVSEDEVEEIGRDDSFDGLCLCLEVDLACVLGLVFLDGLRLSVSEFWLVCSGTGELDRNGLLCPFEIRPELWRSRFWE